MMKLHGRCLGLLVLLAAAASAEVQVQVDRARMTVDDTFMLVLKATEGENLRSADLTPLQRDFTILGNTQSTRHSYSNGRSESITELQISLEPLRSGKLLVPSLLIDGVRTRPVDIEVSAARSGLDASEDIFVETEVDRDQVYVQGQLIYSFRIYQAKELEDRRRSPLELAGATIEELPVQTWQRKVNGRNYLVTEIRYAIFPQNSGELHIPSIAFTAREVSQRRSLFDKGKPLRRRGEDLTVSVLPVATGYPNAPWLPAASMNIEEHWSKPPQDMTVGDSSTRTITLRAQGINGSQLAPIEVDTIDGIKLYPDQPRSENIIDASGVTALGINSAAWVMTQDGEFDIPEVRIPWWNIDKSALEFAIIPARRFTVKPSAVPTSPPTSPTQVAVSDVPVSTAPVMVTQGSPFWQWATLACFAGWLLTTLLLLRNRKIPAQASAERVENDSERALFKTLQAACISGDGKRARELMRQWGASYFQLASSAAITQLGGLIGRADIERELQMLEHALFAPGESLWQGKTLANQLVEWRKQDLKRRASHQRNPLPPLYNRGSTPPA